jgi:hypothetical protein
VINQRHTIIVVIVGITGHQQISAIEWIRQQLRGIVMGESVTQGITSLAVGSDQLFAENLSALRIPYEVIVPCERYRETFDAAALGKYENLLSNAAAVTILPFTRPSEEAFYAAGLEVVNRSDFMIAVWNGHLARGLGGTGDIVNYSRQQGKSVAHLNPLALTVKWL